MDIIDREKQTTSENYSGIDEIIKPFVVTHTYDIPGDFYLSSTPARCIEVCSGLKLFYSNKDVCLKVSEELINAGIEHELGYNEDGNFYSILIL